MAKALVLKEITKRFPLVLANDSISLDLEWGEVLALVGENGAGKSTLMKIVYGLQPPDAGEMWVDGKPYRPQSPLDAIRAGIGMVHQHFMLVEPFTVLENLVLGLEPGSPLFLDLEAARRKATALMEALGFEVPLDERVENLPVGLQQRVEILKALYREARILILDEPTAVLTPQEAEGLFQDQDLGLGEKGPEDLHPLLLPGGEEVDGRLQVHPQRVPRQQGLEPADEGPSGKQEGQVQPQGQVLGHGVGLNELGVLGHEGDAQGLGRLGGGDLDGAPLQEDPPLVRRVKAVEEAHQGGLPRPVLPQEGEDLPGPHLEADAVVGHHRAEAFRDVLQPQHPPPEEDTTPTGGRPCGWR